MEKVINKSLPIWHLLLYFCLIGFTFINVPKLGTTYVLYARLIQAVELIFFIVLLIQNFKRGIRLHGYTTLVNAWWLFYTIIAYYFALSTVGLTPFFNWMNIMIFLLLGNCYWKEYMIESSKYIAIVFSCLIYLNAVLLVLYPEGLWIDEEWIGRGNPVRYLFGNYNMIGFVCLLGIIIHALYTFATGKGRLNLLILILVSVASVVFVGSMTSTVSLGILSLCILLKNIISKRIKVIIVVFTVLYILFFLFIIWYGSSIEEISLATQFIEVTLSKDTTFSNRTELWANAVYKIKQNPWIGFGVQNVEWNDNYLGGSGPHNFWLMLLLQGGYLLCFSFIAIVFFAIKHASQTPNKTTVICILGLLTLFVMSLFEAYNIIQFFLLVQLVYYSQFLNEKEESSLELIS